MEYMGWFWLLHDMELSVELAVLWQQVSPREVLGDLDRFVFVLGLVRLVILFEYDWVVDMVGRLWEEGKGHRCLRDSPQLEI